jgi:hypothetical protein
MGYRFLLLLKFVGVALYAGGLIASFLTSDLQERKRAVHNVASPGLLLIWVVGYLLSTEISVPLTECWILGGLVLSLASQMALVRSASRDRRTVGSVLAAAIPLLLVLVLMVYRPTWSMF